MKKLSLHLVLGALCATTIYADNPAFDWPQFRGPNRDDISQETGLLQQWPADGPTKIWSYTQAGQGYSGFAVVAGHLYTMGTRDGTEILICLDAAKGTEIWTAKLGPILDNKWGDGPRGTPTVDGDRVYTLGGDGTLAAVQATDGKELWRTTMDALGGKRPGWGYTESVLVDGPQVVCTPGGPKGAMAALDKMSGQVLWQSTLWTDGAQYSSIVPADINGQRQYIQRSMTNVVGIAAKDGALLWQVPYPGKTAMIPTPIVKGNQIYFASGYGVGSMSFTVEPGNQTKIVFDETSSTNKVMKNHHGGVILLRDKLYGYSDGLGWTCQDSRPAHSSGTKKPGSAKVRSPTPMAISIASRKAAATSCSSTPRPTVGTKRAASSSIRKRPSAVRKATSGHTR
ncbi:MAG: PQQ-binding-like beta-propeller repeat protein [Chthoniobacter sp.]